MHGNLFTLSLLSLLIAPTAHAGVAQFRVARVQAIDAKQIEVTITYRQKSEGSGQTGKGVRFYLHRSTPQYNHYTNDVIGTHDLQEGAHTLTLMIDRASYNLKDGQTIYISGRWANNHHWGVALGRDTSRLTSTSVTIPKAGSSAEPPSSFSIVKTVLNKAGTIATLWLAYNQTGLGRHSDGKNVTFFAHKTTPLARDVGNGLQIGQRNLKAGSTAKLRLDIDLAQIGLKSGDPLTLSAVWKSGYKYGVRGKREIGATSRIPYVRARR